MSDQPKISYEVLVAGACALHDRYCYADRDDECSGPTKQQMTDVQRVLEAAYPLLRQQWEAEISECDERITLPAFFDGLPQTVPCVRKPAGHPMPHRSADGMEWQLIDRQASDA